jgi:transcriptional regulator with XRE-family HTH domain/quercetin dioxygenase-like cupin family protein
MSRFSGTNDGQGAVPPSDDRPSPAAGPTAAIGGRVASLRQLRGLRVSELARAAGISASLVSQIERGRSQPSVSTLFAISEALQVPVDSFFRGGSGLASEPGRTSGPERASDPGPPGTGAHVAARDRPPARVSQDPDAAGYLVRRGDRAVIDIQGGVRWERLTPGPLPNVDFLELVYAPGAESSPVLYRHPGQEMVLVLTGRLDIYVGFERHELGPGDSMHFPSMLPHRYVNPAETETRAVTTIIRDEP